MKQLTAERSQTEKTGAARMSKEEVAAKIRRTDFSYNVFWGYGFTGILNRLRGKVR